MNQYRLHIATSDTISKALRELERIVAQATALGKPGSRIIEWLPAGGVSVTASVSDAGTTYTATQAIYTE